MKFLYQFGVVLRKSFLIKSKTPIWSLVELLLPVVLLFAVTQIGSKQVSEQMFRPLLCLIYSSTMAGLIGIVVTEKEQRISEMMKIMGLPNWIHYLSWFVSYSTILGVTSVLVAPVIVYADVMPQANVFLVFFYYMLFSTSSIAFSLFISSPFDSAKVAQIVGFLLYGLISLGGSVVSPKWSVGTKCVVTLFAPPVGFSLGVQSAVGNSMTWSNMSQVKNNFSVSYAMLFMFLSTIMYMVLYVYLDQVLPHAVGTRRPFWFPLEFLFPSLALSPKDESAAESQSLFAASGASSVVETKALCKRYNASRQVLLDVNLRLNSGELTVLLGRNGAGKTTLINILTGMTEASSGTARVLGFSVEKNLQQVRENLGFCPQHDIQWPQLTVKEHFEIFGAFRNLSSPVIAERMARLLANIGLSDKSNSPVSTLSGGMKRKLSVALAFLGDSKFVILDEPTSGLDPLSRRFMWTVLGKLREDRVVLLSTHYMDEAEVLGERVVILSDGQVRANGSVNDLKREFDCGYELVFRGNRDMMKMDFFEKIVKSVVTLPGTKLENSKTDSGEVIITVTLPVDAAPLMPSLLAAIKSSSKIAPQDHVNLRAKRLEEVFMSIALDGEVEEIIVPPSDEDLVAESDEEEGLRVMENGVKKIEYVEPGMSLLMAQITGTLIKRWRLFVRELRASALQNLAPFLMIIVGLYIVKDVREDGPPSDYKETMTNISMILFVQFAFSSISSGIVSALARESQTMSKFLQYVAGLMPLAYWTGSFLGDVMEFFALPFTYTSITLAAINLSIPMHALLILLACFGPAVIAQTYALSVLISNPVMSKFVSFLVNTVIGLVLPGILFLLSFVNGEPVKYISAILRVFPSYNLGEGILAIMVFDYGQKSQAQQSTDAGAQSVFDYQAAGAAIWWLIGMTPILFGITVFVDDLRYKNKTTFASRFVAPAGSTNQSVTEDDSVARERARVEGDFPAKNLAMRAVNVSKQWVSSGPLAVDRVALAVARNGEIFTLLGENGAGKTTLMTMAIGQIMPSDGEIFIDTFSTKKELKKARQLIGYCPQFDALLPPLTVKDHLRLFARIKGIESASIDLAVDRIIHWVGLTIFADAKAKTLSGGYQRRLSLAIALMGRPEILILDEPSCGMDPVARRQMWKVMKAASRDSALILTTHSMEEAEAVSTRLGIMSRGRMMCIGTAGELREKFSNGIEVSVKLNPNVEGSELLQVLSACKGSLQYVVERLGSWFSEWLEQADLLYAFENTLSVGEVEVSGPSVRCVVKPVKKDITSDFIGCVFGLLEKLKQSGHVVEFSVSQNSLDQVFTSIASTPVDMRSHTASGFIET